MTQPLQVDTDGLNAASKILKTAAGQIPVAPPQLSVPGTDPLSLAIAQGALQVEAPLGALPGIKANATSVAENIGVAGQKYRETDETLAQKAKQQQFDKDDGDAARGGGIGKYKASPLLGKDLPTLPDDPSGQRSEVGAEKTPEAFPGLGNAINNVDKGTKLLDGAKTSVKAAASDVWKDLRWSNLGDKLPDAAQAGLANDLGSLTRMGGALEKVANKSWVVDLVDGGYEGFNEWKKSGDVVEAIADVAPKTVMGAIAGAGGAEAGAAVGAAIGSFVPGAGTIIGAGLGAAVGGFVASDMGKAAGEAISSGIHAIGEAGSFSEKAVASGQMVVSAVGAAGSAAVNDVQGAAEAVGGAAKTVWSFFAN
jgi:hypothetical protein